MEKIIPMNKEQPRKWWSWNSWLSSTFQLFLRRGLTLAICTVDYHHHHHHRGRSVSHFYHHPLHPLGQYFFLSFWKPSLGPNFLSTTDTGGFLPGGKTARAEDDNTFPSCAEHSSSLHHGMALHAFNVSTHNVIFWVTNVYMFLDWHHTHNGSTLHHSSG